MKNKLLTSAAALTFFGLVSTGSLFAAAKPNGNGPNREEMIKRFDTDGNGKLDKTERGAMMAARASDQKSERGERGGPGGRGDRMKELDTDGDGKISNAERTAGEANMRANIVNNPRAMKNIDSDGDGAISDAEWAAGKEKMGQRGGGGGGGGGKGQGKGKPE